MKPRIFANGERFYEALKKHTHIEAIKFIRERMEENLPCFLFYGKFYFIDGYKVDYLGYMDISLRPSCRPNEFYPIHYFKIHVLEFSHSQNTAPSA